MTEKPVIESIQAAHNFSQEESGALAKSLVARMQEYSQAEAELDSIKQDYKAKLTRIETDRDTIAQKIRDGFEMRPCDAIVLFNEPAPGRKSYFQPNRDRTSVEPGEFIREEGMNGPDFQRSLPLEEKNPETPAEPVPQSADIPPAGFILVTEGDSEEGDMVWNADATEWQAVAQPGTPVSAYKGLWRAIGQPPVFSDETLQQRSVGAGTTPLGELIAKAAAGKETPLVPVKLSKDFPPAKALAQFRKQARKIGWPEASIDVLETECKKVIDPDDDDESIARVLEILNAHTVQEAQ